MPTIYHGRTTTKPTLPMRIAAFINGYILVTALFFLTSTSITLKFDDPVHAIKTDVSVPIRVCNRVAPLPPDDDVQATQQYASCPLLSNPPEQTTILMLDNTRLFGRTGNNLIEFFHSLQYGRDKGIVVGMMQDDWPTRMITEMWMAAHDDNTATWKQMIEQTFCIRVFERADELNQFKEIVRIDTKDLFYYEPEVSHEEYIEFQSHILRALWRSYNNGSGYDVQHAPVSDMCSAVDAIFGDVILDPPVYSVVHSRSLEKLGIKLSKVISDKYGCDPIAALEMQPEYVKAILEPLDLLKHPILFMTDNQRPEVFERLLANPDIGPNIRLIPPEASWSGGDITLALLSDAFIGNPASTFTGFIANSRVALGYNHNYVYRKKDENGAWVNVCDDRCSFGQYLGTR
ncbi:hypothetical protein ACHAXH_001623 [Discostella pseudostelligera]